MLTHIDDSTDSVPLAALLQHRYQLLSQGKDPLNVQGQEFAPSLIRVFIQCLSPCRSGIVDQNVED